MLLLNKNYKIENLNTSDALKHNANITDDEVVKSITFDNLYTDLGATLKAKYERVKEKQENGHKSIGFK